MPGTWFPELANGNTTLRQVVGNRPAYADAMDDVEAAIWSQNVIEPELLALCQLRIAQLFDADGDEHPDPPVLLDPVLVAELRQWPTHPAFTDRQRTCLGFCEQLAIDAQGVSDEQAQDVIATFGEGGFLVLTYACGFFETTQRARTLLAVRSSA